MTKDDVRAAAKRLVDFHERFAPTFGLSFTHISLLTEVLTVINLAAIFHDTVHLFELSDESNDNTTTV